MYERVRPTLANLPRWIGVSQSKVGNIWKPIAEEYIMSTGLNEVEPFVETSLPVEWSNRSARAIVSQAGKKFLCCLALGV